MLQVKCYCTLRADNKIFLYYCNEVYMYSNWIISVCYKWNAAERQGISWNMSIYYKGLSLVYQARPCLTLLKRERRILLVFMSCWPIRSYCSILSQLLATPSASVVRVLLAWFLGCRLNQLWTMNTNTIWRAEGWLPSPQRKHWQPDQDFWWQISLVTWSSWLLVTPQDAT